MFLFGVVFLHFDFDFLDLLVLGLEFLKESKGFIPKDSKFLGEVLDFL